MLAVNLICSYLLKVCVCVGVGGCLVGTKYLHNYGCLFDMRKTAFYIKTTAFISQTKQAVMLVFGY